MTLRQVSPYSLLFDGVLTRMDPERAHHLGFRAIRAISPITTRSSLARLGQPVTAMGVRFPNVLGVAAGFDKNARGINALAGLGFGHVEIGTVTGEPQTGQPQAEAVSAACGPGDHQPDGFQQRRRRGGGSPAG